MTSPVAPKTAKQLAADAFCAKQDQLERFFTSIDGCRLVAGAAMGVPVVQVIPRDPSTAWETSCADSEEECIYCGEIGCPRVDIHGPEFEAQQETQEIEARDADERWKTGKLNQDERYYEIRDVALDLIAKNSVEVRDWIGDSSHESLNRDMLAAADISETRIALLLVWVSVVAAGVIWWVL